MQRSHISSKAIKRDIRLEAGPSSATVVSNQHAAVAWQSTKILLRLPCDKIACTMSVCEALIVPHCEYFSCTVRPEGDGPDSNRMHLATYLCSMHVQPAVGPSQRWNRLCSTIMHFSKTTGIVSNNIRSVFAVQPELSLQSLAGVAGGAITKLQRYVQPPPAGRYWLKQLHLR